MVEIHGDERLSEIDPMPLSMDREDLIAEEAIVISLTTDNYIRHLPVEAFRLQNRGGKGLKGVATKDEDAPAKIVTCFSKDRLLIFTDQGRVYGLRAWETPSASRYGKGSHVRNLLGSIRDEEKVVSILPLDRELISSPEGHFLLFATKKGLIKKTSLKEYVKINRNGKYALRFKIDGDALVNVRNGTEESDIVMISSTGQASRFACSEITATSRNTSGVWGIFTGDRKTSSREGDGGHVVGMVVTNNYETQILTITKNGMGKRTIIGTGERDGYRRTSSGAKGVKTMDLYPGDTIVGVNQIPDEDDQIFMLTSSGMMIRIGAAQTKETIGRASKGTRVMELRDRATKKFTDEIIYVTRLPSELISIEESSEEEE
jgi:DNA gyrase subunit A